MQIEKESLPEFWTGSATIGNSTPTCLCLATVTPYVKKGIYIRVGSTPEGALLRVGKTIDVGVDGFIIPAGETSPLLFFEDLSKVYLISSLDNTPITWIAF